MYLANIEKTESDAADEPYYETDEINSSLEFLQVVDSFGVDVAENLPFHENMLIQEGFFLDRDPDDEEYEGFTGNEGTETTRFYRVTGAIIIPKGFRFLFKLHRLRRGVCNIAEILDECRFLALERPNDDVAKQNLVQACSTVIKKGPPDDVADKIMQIATDFDFVDLFRHAIERFDTHMSPSQLHQIAKFMAKHGFQGLRSGLEHVFEDRIFGWPSTVGRGVSVGKHDYEQFLSDLLNDPESGGHKLADSLTSLPNEGSFES
ncbi:hypothetical protein ASPBRDRAFT_33372 [Aspergillus brasiliensis CBS 101740]|uniref:Uncharacterized protein n=1 Tax=Aspergillus brasiliensis (strain CBS 101740 / IMI 381727 / IBT 21946) TaxID=767769 RepID=A0A1L9U8X0_ASPBC|nr:hypothetical protein ASPBRDRAFT_33372 [Aspergillus brasiliensis CBS 101740]